MSLAAVACAPEAQEATASCNSITDCPLGEVCNHSFGMCMPEPPNRFLGAFQCTVIDSPMGGDNLELSEVIGRIRDDRWALSSVFCLFNPQRGTMLFGFQSLLSQRVGLTVHVDADELTRTGVVELGPYFDAGSNAANMEDLDRLLALGHSIGGYINIWGIPRIGALLAGYLDVTMLPTAEADALFGAPCPNGLAECGRKTFEAGGVAFCSVANETPVCTRLCDGSGDCSLGGGVCVQGLCTRACAGHSDCAPPLECFAGNPGEPNGCF
ncbi:MAG: hypothetical protein KIT72_16635 [Polyangiaceae bacterium]|nr:hypothetical protein [Polyangiaceae bacterium]MCW5792045.1 hypothetical protein [Polyangiaceae bacterium]